jgi:hypothetical protein
MRVERAMDAGPSAVAPHPIGADGRRASSAGVSPRSPPTRSPRPSTRRRGDRIRTPQDDARARRSRRARPTTRARRNDARVALRAARARHGAATIGATTLQGERSRVLAARAIEGRCDGAPGTLRLGGAAPLRIATGDGWLAPRVLQRAGGKPLDVEVFLRGNPLADGARLDS